MPPHIPRTLIEALSLSDIQRFRKIAMAGNESRAFEVLFEIIDRLSKPRVYIAQPIGPVMPNEGLLWSMGGDILSSRLAQHNLHIITPDTLRWIFKLSSESLLATYTIRTNPFIIELMASNYVHEVYLPEESGNPQQGLRNKIEEIASDRNIPIHTWLPRIVTVYRT